MKVLRKTTSLVVRLRSSLIIVLCSMLFLWAATFSQLNSVQERRSDLVDRSLPILFATHRLVTTLGLEAEQIAALGDVDLREDFHEIRAQHLEVTLRFRDQISDLERLTVSESAIISEASRVLQDITDQMIDIQIARHDMWAKNEVLLSALSTLFDEMVQEIEVHRLDVLSALQADLDRGNTAADYRQIIDAHVDQFNAIVALSLTIESMKDVTDQIGSSPQAVLNGQEVQELSLDMRVVAQLLAQLTDLEVRQRLAQDLLLARGLISAPDGLIANATTQNDLQKELEIAINEHRKAISGINETIEGTLASVNQDTLAAGLQLDRSISIAYTLIMLVTILLGVGLVAMLYGLIERQLNRRIQALIASVRRIAEGDFYGPVPVRGSDELGEIGASLREFQKTAQALVRTNTDLESFAYAASHDLQSPLQAISNLAEWTLEDARDELSEPNIEKLEMLLGRTRRITNLLGDLLSYALIQPENDESAPFDLVSEVKALADLIDPENVATITFGEVVPLVETYPVPMRQVLQNLISNAIKHNDRECCQIVISSSFSDGLLSIEVADDGPGIPKEYQSRIFKLFESLRSRDDVEGSGIGLALVHKLANRYGGAVEVFSDPEKERGTRFRVTTRAVEIALQPLVA